MLDSGILKEMAGGAPAHVGCQESVLVCSVMHACVSCRTTTYAEA